MSEVRRKFSALTAASPLEDADVVPVVQNADYMTAETRRTTVGAIKAVAVTAAAAATSTLTWDRISLRTWMEGKGYDWDGGADAAPLINTLLAQTAEGGQMSGKVIVCPPGLLPCLSPLRVPDYARRVALIGDGNFRIEKRFSGPLLTNALGSNATLTPAGQRPREIYLSEIEMGAPYTPDPNVPNYALAGGIHGDNTISLVADSVWMEDVRLWGLGPNARFLGPIGGDWHCDDLDLRYAMRTIGQGGIRIPWADGDAGRHAIAGGADDRI